MQTESHAHGAGDAKEWLMRLTRASEVMMGRAVVSQGPPWQPRALQLIPILYPGHTGPSRLPRRRKPRRRWPTRSARS